MQPDPEGALAQDAVRQLREQFAWLSAQFEEIRQEAKAAAARERDLTVANARLESANAQLQTDLAAARDRVAELDRAVHQWRVLAEARRAELQSIFTSRSWWLTKPLRRLADWRRRRPAPQATTPSPTSAAAAAADHGTSQAVSTSPLSPRQNQVYRDIQAAQAQRKQKADASRH